MLYIYGEQDPWSAHRIIPDKETNSIRFVRKGGNHYTFINTFSVKEREEIFSVLKKWLGIW